MLTAPGDFIPFKGTKSSKSYTNNLFGNFKNRQTGLKSQPVPVYPIFGKSGCWFSPTVGLNSHFFNTCLQLKLRASQRNCDFWPNSPISRQLASVKWGMLFARFWPNFRLQKSGIWRKFGFCQIRLYRPAVLLQSCKDRVPVWNFNKFRTGHLSKSPNLAILRWRS